MNSTHTTGAIIISIIILLLTIPTGCRKHSDAWYQMSKADSLMNENPHSALLILNNIDSSTLSGQEEKARYALLNSMALDKNYIDTTTFEVLQPAIDYYFKKGSPDEKLKTLYYQGCIYLNRNDRDNAMNCFLKADEYRNTAKDTRAIANLLVAQGEIFLDTYKYDEFINNNLTACDLYDKLHDYSNEVRSLLKAFSGCMMSENKERADSIYPIIEAFITNHREFENRVLPYKFSYLNTFSNDEEMRKALEEYNPTEEISDSFKLVLADCYCKIGENDKGKQFFESISDDSDLKNTMKYIAIKSSVLDSSGNCTEALSTYKEFMDSLFFRHLDVFRNDLLFAQSRHKMELANIHEIQKKNKIIWVGLCVCLILLIISCLIFYQLRLRKTQLIIKATEQKKLLLEQNNLKIERDQLILEKKNAELERDRHSLAIENMQFRIAQVEDESRQLHKLLNHNKEISVTVKKVLKDRIDFLKEIISIEMNSDRNLPENYDKLRRKLIKDRASFLDTTRLSFKAAYPEFIRILENAGLNEREINYCCLVALGLRGKEVGEYIGETRHYHISSSIGKKLGVKENNIILRTYIRTLLKDH